MRRFQAPWGIAGGWAIELFTDDARRPHADVDVAILRAHQRQLWIDLQPTTAHVVVDGELHAWDSGNWIPAPLHEVHLGWSNGVRLEILLNEHDDATSEWIYRRDERIRRELARTFIRFQDVPCLAPETVLLYKSKAPRAHDQMDFDAALPHLNRNQREWLRNALAVSAPDNAWLPLIDRYDSMVAADLVSTTSPLMPRSIRRP